MSRCLLVVLTLAFSMTASADLPGSWNDVINNPKLVRTPSIDEMNAPAVAATGGYQTFKVADRFIFLFDPEGRPVVTFDLTMDPLDWKDMALGAIGIGHWSLRDLFKKYKKEKENPNDFLKGNGSFPIGILPDQNAEDEARYEQLYRDLANAEGNRPASNEDAIKRGYEEFAKLRFNDGWLLKNGYTEALAQRKHSGFSPASFALSDLEMSDHDFGSLYPALAAFAQGVYGVSLQEKDAADFLNQFKFNWNGNKNEFDLVWSPGSVNFLGKKNPPIPGWVVNYTNPYDILAYKTTLERINVIFGGLDVFLGQYGAIASVICSRITNNLKARLDYHENELTALLEAALRGEYKVGIPLVDPIRFIDVTTTMLYLNKLEGSDDILDGAKKRKGIMDAEAKYRGENLEWLKKKGYEVQLWPDKRFGTFYKDKKRKGIVSLAIKRFPLIHTPSFHLYENAYWFKTFSRVGMEIFTDAFRIAVPSATEISNFLTSLLHIGISIYYPSIIWDALFRGRIFTETAYEGHSVAMVNESLAGRFKEIPGFSRVDLEKVKVAFYSQSVNPFEVPLKLEEDAKAVNWKLIRDLLGGGNQVDYRYIKNPLLN